MCGFTAGNYPQLQELHRKYSEQGLSVLGTNIMLYLLGKQIFVFIYIFFKLFQVINLVDKNRCQSLRSKISLKYSNFSFGNMFLKSLKSFKQHTLNIFIRNKL